MEKTNFQPYAIEPETRQWLDTVVVKTVLDTYENYNKYKTAHSKEPALSVTMVLEMIGAGPWNFERQSKKSKARLVWAALEKARKAGKLGSSIGIGLNGKEARNYEPPAAK